MAQTYYAQAFNRTTNETLREAREQSLRAMKSNSELLAESHRLIDTSRKLLAAADEALQRSRRWSGDS